MRTETKILVSAMYELARSIRCDDGVANSAIAEAAQRLDEQKIRINMLETSINATIQENLHLADGNNCTLRHLTNVVPNAKLTWPHDADEQNC